MGPLCYKTNESSFIVKSKRFYVKIRGSWAIGLRIPLN